MEDNDLPSSPIYSIITPTFNRAHTLYRVYESLKRQSVNDFEWIVIDDGSTDNTPNLLKRLQQDVKFSMTWCRYTNNRGRNAAVNAGIRLVSGQYTIILDSDDELFDEAIEKISYWVSKTKIERDETTFALLFRCIDQNGSMVGEVPKMTQNLFSDDILTVSKRDGRCRLGLDVEVLCVAKSKIFKQFCFVELTDHEHCQEAITYNEICSVYNSIYVNEALRKYWRFDGDCLSDGASSGIKWPRGNYLWGLSVLNKDIQYFQFDRKQYFNCARKITRLGLLIGRPLNQQYRDLTNRLARLIWFLVIWRGLLGYTRDRLLGTKIPRANPDITEWGPADLPENWEIHSTVITNK